MTAMVCSNRFGRSWMRPGGSMFDLTPVMFDVLLQRLEVTYEETKAAVDLLWNTPSVMARFEETGRLTDDMCTSLGLVGVAARACRVRRDVRYEFPSGIYRFVNIPIVSWPSGDVFSRAQVRWWEIMNSVAFIQKRLTDLSAGKFKRILATLCPRHADHLAGRAGGVKSVTPYHRRIRSNCR